MALVVGEAPESDDENNLDGLKNKFILAAEVKGEATESESDEDIFEKPASSTTTAILQTNNNILHHKLIASNLEVAKRLRSIARDYVANASKTVVNCDHLVRSQLISMQSILSSLKTSNDNTRQLREKMGCLFPNNFIPAIKIEQEN